MSGSITDIMRDKPAKRLPPLPTDQKGTGMVEQWRKFLWVSRPIPPMVVLNSNAVYSAKFTVVKFSPSVISSHSKHRGHEVYFFLPEKNDIDYANSSLTWLVP